MPVDVTFFAGPSHFAGDFRRRRYPSFARAIFTHTEFGVKASGLRIKTAIGRSIELVLTWSLAIVIAVLGVTPLIVQCHLLAPFLVIAAVGRPKDLRKRVRGALQETQAGAGPQTLPNLFLCLGTLPYFYFLWHDGLMGGWLTTMYEGSGSQGGGTTARPT